MTRQKRYWVSGVGALMAVACWCAAPAIADESRFASEELNLLTAEESATLTDQALLVAESTTIKSHPSKEKIGKMNKFINSGILLSNFPLARVSQEGFLSIVDDAMSVNRRIRFAKELDENPDGGVMTTISIIPQSPEKSIIEVSIVAFDWEKAASLKAGMDGVMQSTVWYSISRKAVALSSEDPKSLGTNPVVEETYKALVRVAFESFLLQL